MLNSRSSFNFAISSENLLLQCQVLCHRCSIPENMNGSAFLGTLSSRIVDRHNDSLD
jgi:hypothetical protein